MRSQQEQREGGAGRGWLQGAAGCGQGPLQGGGWPPPTSPCKGDRLQPRAPCKGAVGHLQGAAATDCQRRTSKGRPPTASPQEAAHGAPTRGGRQRPSHKGLPPAGTAAPVAGVAAPCQGGYRSQRVAPSPTQG
ncbi:hypothetical protein BHE74_00035843 [Ensete ventricosum]|nr:hypothetical protein BHE74_00035843 [Ensete ventricosum]RZS23124.1 hypothetical protein BHM03_00055983 [Ensete ventricosum]